MSDGPFISYAQNAEDVILWRALQHVANGHYVEVGANHPRVDSVTRAFYDRGWTGITIEPLEEFAALHRAERPDDTLLQVAVSDRGADSITLHAVPGSGLSSTVDAVGERHRVSGQRVEDVEVPARTLEEVFRDAGWGDKPVHFMVVDVEGAEAAVLRGLDLSAHRPWVLVVEATAPNSTEPTHTAWEPALIAAGYTFCLFDGLSRFYVADEHREEFGGALSYPACVFDDYVPARFDDEWRRLSEELESRSEELEGQILRWKRAALVEWADAAAATVRESKSDLLRGEIEAMRRSASWRITRPLRTVGRLLGRLR